MQVVVAGMRSQKSPLKLEIHLGLGLNYARAQGAWVAALPLVKNLRTDVVSWHVFGSSSCMSTEDILLPAVLGLWLDSELMVILCLSPHHADRHSVQQCSATCGEGIQQRQVVCRTTANSLRQCEGDKPDTVQVCSLPACEGERGGSGRPSPASLALTLHPGLRHPKYKLSTLHPKIQNPEFTAFRGLV